MDNLYIIESPFQLLSAIEADNYFKCKGLFIIKNNAEYKTEKQIKKLLEMFNISKKIEINAIWSNFDANIQLLILLKKFLRQKRKFKRIFIGEYRSYHMRKYLDYFPEANAYCLDDGNISFEINNYIKYKQDLFYFTGVKGSIKKILYYSQAAFLNLHNSMEKRDISVFTCFDMDLSYNKNNIKHNFSYIKSFSKMKKLENKVYLYGTNLETLNISISQEIEYIKIIKKYYERLDIDVIYIPHRKESEKKLQQIERILPIQINEYLAEVQMVLDQSKPRHIASIMSSVLVTLPIISEFDTVICFVFTFDNIPIEYINELKQIKKQYSQLMDIVEMV